MRNYKKYRSNILDLFVLFLNDRIDKNGLIGGLRNVESELINGRKTLKSLWFKFFDGDTGATDIQNINFGNDKYYKECMQISIDNPKELKIYYS